MDKIITVPRFYLPKLQKKHFAKKCKNKSCRDALPPKNIAPKTNETSNHAHRKACIDYTHHSAMHLLHSYHPYIFPTTPTQSIPHPILNCTPNTSQHTPPSTIITINHNTSFPFNNILIHSHYIIHKTRHPTLQPTQTLTATLLRAKCASLHIHKAQPSRTILHYTTLPPTRTTNITHINCHIAIQRS